MGQPTFRTSRLLVRPATADDAAYLHQLWSGPEVRRYLFDDRPVSPELAGVVLDSSLRLRESGLGLWILVPLAEAAPIGCVGLHPVELAAQYAPALEGMLEPLAALDPRRWREGFANESLAALLAYAFDEIAVPNLAGIHDVPNEASARMLRRLGFEPNGEVDGPRYRLRLYRLDAETFHSAKAKGPATPPER